MSRTIQVTLDAIAHGGEAIGRHEGRVVFVPYALPGETVTAEIVEERERWARGRLIEVLMPSPDRVAPPCAYFGPGLCGGCQWQHIRYERQAELKREIVLDQLRRLGRIDRPNVADTIALADGDEGDEGPWLLDYGYLNTIRFTVDAEGRLTLPREGHAGFLPVDACLLVHERLDELHAALEVAWPEMTALSLRCGINTGDALVVLETEGEDQPELEVDLPAALAVQTGRTVAPLIGDPWVFEEVGGRRYRVSARSFFPPNTAGAGALADVVLAYADPQPEEVIVDAYCGVGLFSLALADAGSHVIGLESSPAACEDFAINAGDRENVELHEGPVEEILPALQEAGLHPNTVVLDPPHAGAGPDVVAGLAALHPQRIVLVSGDAAALGRDAAHLVQAGYHLVEAQPVDLFPQTSRVDSISLWER